jgi:hypothetical protein
VKVRWCLLFLAFGCVACGSPEATNDDEVVDTTLNDGAEALNASTADFNADVTPAEDVNAYAPTSEEGTEGGSYQSQDSDYSSANSVAAEPDTMNEPSNEEN